MLHNYHPYNSSLPYGKGLGATSPGSVVTTVGAGIAAFAPVAGPLAPVVLVVGGLVALSGQILNLAGIGIPDMKKIQASKTANDVESQMAEIQTWWNGVEHTTANQQIAVTAWYQLWDKLVQLCGDPNLKSAGENCIKDRQKGGKWDWFAMHLDPILNTPLTDTGIAGSLEREVGSMFGSSGSGGNSIGLLLLGGALLFVASMSGDSKN